VRAVRALADHEGDEVDVGEIDLLERRPLAAAKARQEAWPFDEDGHALPRGVRIIRSSKRALATEVKRWRFFQPDRRRARTRLA
jgi:hypothetical protein